VGQIELEFDRMDDDFRFLDAAEHPDIAHLTGYWHEKRGHRAMPDRTDIVPSEIISLLPQTVIYDVLDDGRDFRVRIFGTGLVELVGEERTGMLVSEFGQGCNPPTNADAVRRRWMDSLSAAYVGNRPVFVKGRMSSSRRPYIVWHGVSCPLSDGHGKASQMIGVMAVER
jgi:hypothetical protein